MVLKNWIRNSGLPRRSFLSEPLEPRRMLSLSSTLLGNPQTTQGNSWTYNSYSGTVSSANLFQTQTDTVGPATTEDGQPATEFDISSMDGNVSGSSKRYIGQTTQGLVEYEQTGQTFISGSLSASNVRTFTTPEILFPATLTAGVTVTETDTDSFTSTSASGTITQETNAITETGTLVSDTTQSITVPAGTFNCYQVNETEVDVNTIVGSGISPATTTTDTSIYLAQGVGMVETTSGSTPSASDIEQLTAFTGGDRLVFAPQQLPNVQAGDPIQPSFTVSVEDSTGTVETDASGTVTLTPAGVNAANPITGNTAALEDGVATFSDVVLTKAGVYQLNATDTNDDAMGTSSKFGVGGDTLTFAVQPKDTDPGQPLTVKVSAFTGKGKLDTALNDTVQLGLNTVTGGVGATLAGTTTLAFKDGSALFTSTAKVSVGVPGTYKLSATALSDGSTDYTVSGATSDPFSIGVDHLVLKLQPPSEVDALKPIPLVVEEVDSHGKVNTSQNSASVALALQSVIPGNSMATLGGTVSASFVSGVAKFTTTAGPTISSPGTFDLMISQSGTADPAASVITRAIKVIGYHLSYDQRLSFYENGGYYASPGRFVAAEGAIATGDNKFDIRFNDQQNKQMVFPAGTTLSTTVKATSGNGTLVQDSALLNGFDYDALIDVSAPGVYQLTFTVQFPAGSSIQDSAVEPLTVDSVTYVLPGVTTESSRAVVAGETINYGGGLYCPLTPSKGVIAAPSQSCGYLISISGGSADANLPNDFVYAANDSGSAPKLVIDTPGSYKLTATVVITPGGLPFDGSNYAVDSSLTPAVTTLRILPTKLKFVTPPAVRIIANSAFSVTVALTDSAGQVLSDFDDSPDDQSDVLAVVLTGSSANGVAGFVNPTPSPVVLVNGTATFSNLFFSQPGIYALHAELDFVNTLVSSVTPFQVPNTINLISGLIRVTI